MIREGKGHQLNSVIQTGLRQGMVLLDDYLLNLVRSGTITQAAALEKASNKTEFIASLGRP
jgi:twitching motility protein PilT